MIRLVIYGCYHDILLRYAAPPTPFCALPPQTLLKLGPMPNAYKISNKILKMQHLLYRSVPSRHKRYWRQNQWLRATESMAVGHRTLAIKGAALTSSPPLQFNAKDLYDPPLGAISLSRTSIIIHDVRRIIY